MGRWTRQQYSPCGARESTRTTAARRSLSDRGLRRAVVGQFTRDARTPSRTSRRKQSGRHTITRRSKDASRSSSAASEAKKKSWLRPRWQGGLSVGTKKNVEQKNLALATGTSGAQSSRQRRCFHKKRTLRRRQTVWAITVRPDNSDWTPLCTARARAPRTTGLSRRERVIRIAIAEQHDRPKPVGSCCEDAPAAVASVLCSGERRMLTMHCPERARA